MAPRKVKLTDVPEERLAKVAGILGIGTDQLVDRLRVRNGEVGFFVDGGWCWVWDPRDDVAEELANNEVINEMFSHVIDIIADPREVAQAFWMGLGHAYQSGVLNERARWERDLEAHEALLIDGGVSLCFW